MQMKEIDILRNFDKLSQVDIKQTLEVFSLWKHKVDKHINLWVFLVFMNWVDKVDQVLNELFLRVFKLLLEELIGFFCNVNMKSSLSGHYHLDLPVVYLLNSP